MTLDFYNEKISELAERKDYDNLVEFQNVYMNQFLKEYEETVKGNPAKKVCYELLEYAIHDSESGSAIAYVDTEELANEVDEIIWEEIGDYLLDSPQIYKSNGQWAIDCMFAGSYVPDWDGWLE